MKKIFNIRNISLMGMFLSLLILVQYIQFLIPSINGISFFNLSFFCYVLIIFILPISISILPIIISPFLWWIMGITFQVGPGSFFLDYSLPLLALLVIKISSLKYFMVNKIVHSIFTVIFVSIAFFIKWQSNSLSGWIYWGVSYPTSLIMNGIPVLTTWISVTIFLIPIIWKLENIQTIIKTGEDIW